MSEPGYRATASYDASYDAKVIAEATSIEALARPIAEALENGADRVSIAVLIERLALAAEDHAVADGQRASEPMTECPECHGRNAHYLMCMYGFGTTPVAAPGSPTLREALQAICDQAERPLGYEHWFFEIARDALANAAGAAPGSPTLREALERIARGHSANPYDERPYERETLQAIAASALAAADVGSGEPGEHPGDPARDAAHKRYEDEPFAREANLVEVMAVRADTEEVGR